MRRLWLGLVLLVPLAMAGCAPSKATLFARGEAACQPILVALREYHVRHGHYPAALDELVADGLLDAVPEQPNAAGADKRPLEYHADPDTDIFRLSFAYDIHPTYGLGEVVRDYFVSDEGK